ncbi:MAG: hypothetical protein Tsb005_15840 [Gammaproteobacteria bacterium]
MAIDSNFTSLIKKLNNNKQAIQKIFQNAKIPSWKILLVDKHSNESPLIAKLPCAAPLVILLEPDKLTQTKIFDIKQKLITLLEYSLFKLELREDFQYMLLELGVTQTTLESELNKAFTIEDLPVECSTQKIYESQTNNLRS